MSNLVYLYDGSWAGLLTCIFESFVRKDNPNAIISDESKIRLFDTTVSIITNETRAERVKNGLKKASNKTYHRIYSAFLSEKNDREILCLELSKLVFKNPESAENNYGNKFVLRAKQIEKEMSREVHRMHAFVRFQRGVDDIWYAFIKPDFDVMPLIGIHFERRYADQKWVIYDLSREVGLYYDLETTEYITINFKDIISDGRLPEVAKHPKEKSYQVLWKCYFESVNIKERKNMKLHIQHVPKRYWNLMTEKS